MFNLNEIDYYKYPEKYFPEVYEKFQKNLETVMMTMNQISPSSTLHKKFIFPQLLVESPMNWNAHSYTPTSVGFRRAYITMLCSILHDMGDEISSRAYRINKKNLDDKYNHPYFFLCGLWDDFREFTKLFLHNRYGYHEAFYKVFRNIAVLQSNNKNEMLTYVKSTDDILDALASGMEKKLFTQRMLDDATTVDLLMKAAVLLCTGCPYDNELPDVKTFEEKRVGFESYRPEIATIGKVVINAQRSGKNGYLFDMFQLCHPKYNKVDVKTDLYYGVGVEALEFVKMVVASESCNRFIDIMRGIEKKPWIY